MHRVVESCFRFVFWGLQGLVGFDFGGLWVDIPGFRLGVGSDLGALGQLWASGLGVWAVGRV